MHRPASGQGEIGAFCRTRIWRIWRMAPGGGRAPVAVCFSTATALGLQSCYPPPTLRLGFLRENARPRRGDPRRSARSLGSASKGSLISALTPLSAVQRTASHTHKITRHRAPLRLFTLRASARSSSARLSGQGSFALGTPIEPRVPRPPSPVTAFPVHRSDPAPRAPPGCPAASTR